MRFRTYAIGISVAALMAVATAPAMAQKGAKGSSRAAALKKCIQVMTQYVKFDGKAEAARSSYDSGTSDRYNNLYANCMKDHGQAP